MNRTNRINETPPLPTKEASPVVTKDSQPLASKENDPSAAATVAAPAASVEDEPYRQLLPDQAEEEEVTPQQPRKRLLNFKIPLLNKGSQRRNQGVSLVARRKVVRPHSPVPAPPTGIVLLLKIIIKFDCIVCVHCMHICKCGILMFILYTAVIFELKLTCCNVAYRDLAKFCGVHRNNAFICLVLY